VANELCSRGHKVRVYALPLLLDGKRKCNPNELLRDVEYFEGKHFKVKADVCYVTYNPLSFLFFQTSHPRIAGLHAQSYWIKPHLSYGFYPLTALTIYRLIGNLDLKGFDKVHTVSPCYELNHVATVCIPNFVDSEKYKPCKKHDRFTVCYFSRNNWQKGYDVALALKNALGDSVDFLFSNGEVPESEMPRFIGACQVAVVPSRVDTFGLSIVEALMCGVPVVTSNLETHRALGLPVRYASSLSDYVRNVKSLKSFWENRFEYYDEYTRYMRDSAIKKYGKTVVMDKLEEMIISSAS